jgi:thiamine-phosphate pyrophosphorylase
VAWWAELFEIPCVGFAASLDEVKPLVAAGADFVAIGDCIFADARGDAAAVAEAARRLAVAETVA